MESVVVGGFLLVKPYLLSLNLVHLIYTFFENKSVTLQLICFLFVPPTGCIFCHVSDIQPTLVCTPPVPVKLCNVNFSDCKHFKKNH